MSRIKTKFEEIKTGGAKGFIPFITAGDPDPGTTLRLMRVFADQGATVIELGVPFSDPMADGPVIQASSQRALENHNISIGDVLEIVAAFRLESDVPIVLFGYLNPFLKYGFTELARDSQKAGVDGFLITDVIDDEFLRISQILSELDMDLISLIAPTTTDDRLETILKTSRGFVYAISTTGITGNAAANQSDARKLVTRARNFTDLPVAVGFGVSSRDDINNVLKYADAAVVGSAIVRKIAESRTGDEAVNSVGDFVKTLLE